MIGFSVTKMVSKMTNHNMIGMLIEMYPDDLKYSKEHEWVRMNGNIAEIGVTVFAQESLGDVVFVDLPKAGTKRGSVR